MMRTHIRTLAIAVSIAASGAIMAQSVSGTVVATDTGAPIAAATVVAIQQTASRAQRPVMYKAVADAAGRYAISVSTGKYQICVHDAGLYLNPCQWDQGNPAVTVETATVADLRLKKGGWFIVRVHDTPKLLPQVETVRGSAVAVHLSTAALTEFPLPLIYHDDRIRDYGTVVPMNLAMRARIASPALVLAADRGGAPLSADGVPFQVTPADLPSPSKALSRFERMFPRPTAKFLHVYAADRK